MGSVFSMMTPMRTMTKYNLDLLDALDDRKKFLNFLRMEKWIADRPDHPGEAAKQWLKDLYQDNKLVESAFELGGRRALEMAGLTIDDVAIVDLYSCFPSAVQLGAQSLGLDINRQLTRTGGLSFAGGPWNNYVMHSISTVVALSGAASGEMVRW